MAHVPQGGVSAVFPLFFMVFLSLWPPFEALGLEIELKSAQICSDQGLVADVGHLGARLHVQVQQTVLPEPQDVGRDPHLEAPEPFIAISLGS